MRRRNIPSTLIIRLSDHVSTEEFEDFLEEYGLTGTPVSCLTRKYAIEVPAEEEERYQKFFEDSGFVRYVNPDFIKGQKFKPIRRKDDQAVSNKNET